ncbi:MAG: DUF6020 family protein [Olsenella sp.]|jgi:hypothetical protein
MDDSKPTQRPASARASKGTVGLAVLGAALIALGNLISEVYRDSPTSSDYQTGLGMATCLAHALVIFLVAGVVSFLLFRLWDSCASVDGDAPLHWRSRLTPAQFFAVGTLVLAIPWLCWAVAHFPGTMRDDTISQLFQYRGAIGYYSQHPVLDTLVFGLFWDLGSSLGNAAIGMFVFILIQIALTSCAISICVSYAREHGFPEVAAWAILAIAALSRAFYQPVDTMSKDALNGWLFVLAFFCYMRTLDSGGEWLASRARNVIATVVVTALCVTTKRTLLYVFAVSYLLVALSWAFSRKARPRSRKALIVSALTAVGSLALSLCVITPVLNSTFHVAQNKTYEMYSVPEQQVIGTLRAHPDALSASEVSELDQVMDVDRAIEAYNPSRSDEVSATMRPDGQATTLLRIWLELGLRHPGSYFSAYARLASGWMSLTTSLSYAHEVQGDLLTPARVEAWSSFFSGDQGTVLAFFEDADFTLPESLSTLNGLLEGFDAWQVEYLPVLSSYGLFCFALPVDVLVYLVGRRRGAKFLALLPYFVVPASLAVGPIALYWYSIPSVYATPLVVGTTGLSDNEDSYEPDSRPRHLAA